MTLKLESKQGVHGKLRSNTRCQGQDTQHVTSMACQAHHDFILRAKETAIFYASIMAKQGDYAPSQLQHVHPLVLQAAMVKL